MLLLTMRTRAYSDYSVLVSDLMAFSLRLLRSQDRGQHATSVTPQRTSMQPSRHPGMRVAE